MAWFIEHTCVFSNGRWTGEPFRLLPWQRRLLYELFEVDGRTGRRIYRRALIGLPRKAGKALALDTPVPTPGGWTTMGALEEGAELFASDGTVCRVVATSEVFTDHDCYRMRFSNGEEIVADAGHKWVTKARVDQPGVRATARTTAEIAATLRAGVGGDANHSLVMADRTVQIAGCERVASVPVKCIAVDSPDHQFLVGRTMLPTHNTELAAAIGLYLMLADGERSAQVYCAAASEEQADIVFEAAKRMCEIESSPLQQLVDVQVSRLTSKADPYSYIQRLSSKGRTKHGLNIHGVILDELHAWGSGEGEELWAALNTGSAARAQPMQIAITTAGTDLEASRCGQLYLLGRAIERGEQPADGLFFRWWQAPEGMDYRDPDYPRLASPSYGHTVDEGFYRAELTSVPEAMFRRLYGNEWVDYGEKPWVTRQQIRACRLPPFPLEAGASTWVGIDLSETRDSTAVAWVQWRPEADRPCAVLHEELPDAPCLYIHTMTWEQPRLTDGRGDEEWEVPQAAVKAFVRDLNAEYSVQANVFDPWHSKLMRQDLQADGIPCEEIPQSGARRSGASARLYDLIVQRRIHYCDDTFERHVMNATIKTAGDEGGYYIAKRRKGKVMDAAMAAVNAVYALDGDAPVDTSWVVG